MHRHLSLMVVGSLIALPLLTSNVAAHSSGAPLKMCKDMKPNHGEQSSSKKFPYRITLDSIFVKGGSEINIKVTPTETKYAPAGFLLVMKPVNELSPAFGTFAFADSDQGLLKTIPCFEKEDSGLTHTSSEKKQTLYFKWRAPTDVSRGEYELHATMVWNYHNFWVYTHPEKIRVSNDAPYYAPSKSFSSARTGKGFSIYTLLVVAALLPIFAFRAVNV